MVRLDPCLECATAFADRLCQLCVIRQVEEGFSFLGRVRKKRFLPEFQEIEQLQKEAKA